MGARSPRADADQVPESAKPKVKLRAATAADVPSIVRIERASFSDPWSARAFEGLLASASVRTMVAERDGQVIGYSVVVGAADEGELANIAVDPDCRRQGVSALLLSDLLATAERTGVMALFLEVRESNTAARALYERFGFGKVGRRRGYYQRPTEDALVLRWSASAPAAP